MSKKKNKNKINKKDNIQTNEENTSQKVSSISPEQSKKICFHCLQEKPYIKIPINPLGYESFFDSWGTEIHLCQDCIDSCLNPSIWDISSGTLRIVKKQTTYTDGTFATDILYYSHEDEIVNYINQLPIQSQELIFNRFAWGSSIIPMNSQDWIDYNSGILSHEQTKKYGLISLDELKAYYQKFPICKYVRIFTELDEPIYSACFFNCKGDKDGNCLNNPSYIPCYNCEFFKEKEQGVNTFLNIDKNLTYNITVSKDELKLYLNNK